MNKYIKSEADQHVMKLIQMGADVKIVSGQMIYVSFEITKDIKVSYVYHLNKKNKFFLERIKPYPIPVREFESADAICDIIQIDVDQFRDAARSHNINDFIEINTTFHNTTLIFEDLFLYYNVDAATFSKIKENLCNIHTIIKQAKESSKRIYFKKDPDNLKSE